MGLSIVPGNTRKETVGVQIAQDRQDDFRADAHREPGGNVADILRSSIGGSAVRNWQDEFQIAVDENAEAAGHADPTLFDKVKAGGQTILGISRNDEDWDKEKDYTALTAGVPWNYHQDIMDHDNLMGAQRARQRILDKMTLNQRIDAQGAGANPMYLVDIDLPLMFLTGGAFSAVKTASMSMKVAKGAGLGARAQKIVGGVAQGLSGGLEAGAITSAGGLAWDETFGWTEAAMNIVGAGIMGTALGGVGAPQMGRKGTAEPSPADQLAAKQANRPRYMEEGNEAIGASFQRTQDDLVEQVKRQEPALHAEGDDLSTSPITTPNERQALDDAELEAANEAGPEGKQSIGALKTPDRPVRTNLEEDPAGYVSDTNQRWADSTEDWKEDTGYQTRKLTDIMEDPIHRLTRALGIADNKIWQKAADLGHKASGNFFAHSMWKSGSSVANWLGGAIFESGSGLGRGTATAGAMNKVFHNRIGATLPEINTARNAWAKDAGRTWGSTGHGVSAAGRREFDRLLRLELNARDYKRPLTADVNVKAAANAQGKISIEATRAMIGGKGQRALDGAENMKENAHWQSYTWSGGDILDMLKSGKLAHNVRESRKILITALAKSYRSAGMKYNKDATLVAEAVISRALRSEQSVETSVFGLLNKDGQDFMMETLEMNDIPKDTREGIMQRLVGDRSEGSQEGFTKSRNDVDMATVIPTLDGSDLKIVDLMGSDMDKDTQTYIRRVAGSSALARQGITNRAQRLEVATAMNQQQRALGEPVTEINEIMAMFSHFDGGGVKGYSGSGDAVMAEQNSVLLRMAANLAYLGKLGLTQLGETGAMIGQFGARNFYERSIKGWFDKEARKGRKHMLESAGFITGRLGYDQLVRGSHLNLDEVAKNGSELNSWLTRKVQDGNYLQATISGFNHIKGEQQSIAAAAVIDQVFQALRKQGPDTMDDKFIFRMWNDLGLDVPTLRRLHALANDGTSVKYGPGGFVDEINSTKWDQDLTDTFGSAIHRNLNQLVQESMAGEQDALLSSTFMGMMTHLITFPMAAVNKQARRQLRAGDSQAAAAVAWSLGTATVAVVLRNMINGKEQNPDEIARKAFAYSNFTGWAVMGSDILMNILGMDSLKIDPWMGKGDLSPPALAWLGNVQKVPGAAIDLIDGDGVSSKSRSAFRALPFANAVGMSNAIMATK